MKHYEIVSKRDKPIHIDINFSKYKNKPIVIFSHGFKGFKDWGPFNHISKLFSESDINFLKFNFSHNGVSLKKCGYFSDLELFGNNNLSIEIEDLNSVIEWVSTKLINKVNTRKIYLMGHSRGGSISILVASSNKKIKKLVTWASVSDFEKRIVNDRIEIWRKKGVVYVYNSRTNQQMPLYYQFYEDFIKNKTNLSISNACLKLSIPTLIIHGDKDNTVDLYEANELNMLIKNSLLIKIIDSDHVFNSKHPFDKKNISNQLKDVIDKSISFLTS